MRLFAPNIFFLLLANSRIEHCTYYFEVDLHPVARDTLLEAEENVLRKQIIFVFDTYYSNALAIRY